MTRYILIALVAGLAFSSPVHPVFAQDENTMAQEQAEDPLMKSQEQAVKKSRDLIEVLVKDLTGEQKKHFFLIYSSYNLINTVEIVKRDVGDAVKQCGEKNPEMKGSLDEEFKGWDAEVSPVIKEAQGNLDNMVIAQDYAKRKDIQRIFKSIDTAREKTDARFEKVPVTTAEACEALQEKMGETKGSLVKLLRSTLVSFPQAAQGMGASEEEKPESE